MQSHSLDVRLQENIAIGFRPTGKSQNQKPNIYVSPRLRVICRLDDICCKRIQPSDKLQLMRVPLSDCELQDPRQKRTRRLLQDALRKLLQEKPFEEILVQDITDTATVNRATFYDHYTDKFTLFEAMVAADFHALLKERNIRFDGNRAGIEAVLLAVCDYLKEIDKSKKQCTNKGSFGPLLDSAVTRAIRIVVLDGVAKRGTRTRVSNDVLASTISWAIYGTTREWFYSKKRPTVGEIVSLVVRIVGPAFESRVTKGKVQ